MSKKPNTDRIRIREAAEIIGVKRARVEQLVRAGRLLAELDRSGPTPYYVFSRRVVAAFARVPRPKTGRKPRSKTPQVVTE